MKKIFFANLIPFVFFFFDRFLKIFFNHARRGFLFKNPYLAFSLPFPKDILIILIIIIIFVLILFLIKSYQRRNVYQIFSLTLIILGAFSNLMDRLVYGYVIDYINVPFFTVFNLADAMIVVGIAVIVYKYLFKFRNNKI
ncbi:MAG: signal peptidase II [Parcubacteria group bacterium Athens1014_10]|nr:MAG: signal peptidase II [Parcubacteria group bacterium Athens1014_10]TSD05909.1 MAG: signal peptidase II [Parcubacteria group bacterium Athens0714_12]